MLGLHDCELADQLHAQAAICSEQKGRHFSRLSFCVVSLRGESAGAVHCGATCTHIMAIVALTLTS